MLKLHWQPQLTQLKQHTKQEGHTWHHYVYQGKRRSTTKEDSNDDSRLSWKHCITKIKVFVSH